MSPPVDGGHPDPAPRGGRALAVGGGAWGAVVSGDVEEGVEEEVSDAFPQGGRLDQGGRPDAGAGGGGIGDGGGAPWWALLPPGLGRLGLNVIEGAGV